MLCKLVDVVPQPLMFSEHSEGEDVAELSLGSGVKMSMGVVGTVSAELLLSIVVFVPHPVEARLRWATRKQRVAVASC